MSAVFTAKHRFARITARKARYVADLIRGRSVNEALELLAFTHNRGSSFYKKVLQSAVANASHDEAINVNRLMVSEARADDGPLLNNRLRFRPGPQGRAMPFSRRMSHLTVGVKEAEEPVEGVTGGKKRSKSTKKSAAKSAESKASAKSTAKSNTGGA